MSARGYGAHGRAPQHGSDDDRRLAQDDGTGTKPVTGSKAANAKDGSSEGAEEQTTASIGSSALLISACTIASRVTGFFRTWAMAFALGSTMLSSSYQVANNLPNMLYELVAGGMIVTAFLPVYVSVKKRAGAEGGNAYASNLLGVTAIFLGLVALLCTLFAPQLIYTQSAMSSQEDMGTAVLFFRFFAVQIVFYGLGAIVSGVLNAERDFLWSSLAPAFNNVVVIATFVSYALIAPSDPDLALYIIAVGNPLGVLLQLAIQLPALRRHGVRVRWRLDLHDPALRETLSIGIPAVLVMATSFFIVSAQTTVAYRIADNGPSIIAYARLWFTFPYSFLAVPITTAMFTELSEMIAAGDMDRFKRGVADGTSQILFLTVPFAMYLAVFAMPLSTLYHAGAFTSDDIRSVGVYLGTLAVSLPFYSVSTYLQKIYSSMRLMKRFAVINVVCAGVQVFFTVVMGAYVMVDTPWALEMVALGETVFYLVLDATCFAYLRKEHGSFGLRAVLSTFVKIAVLGAAGAAAGFAVGPGLIGAVTDPETIVSALLQVLVGGVVALAVTFGAAYKLDVPGSKALQSVLSRVKGKLIRR